MSLQDALETDLLELLLQNVTLANFGDAGGIDGATSAGNIFVALMSSGNDDTTTDIATNELNYTGYGRQSTSRAVGGTGWNVSGDIGSNATAITFGENTGTSQTSANVGLSADPAGGSGTGILHMLGTASLVVSVNVNPQFAIDALDIQLG